MPFLDQFSQDVRYAIRGLRKSPGFAAAVILTIGLGVGANVAMFGVVDRLMFRPYAYLRDPATAHRVYIQQTDRGVTRTQSGYEFTRYLDMRKWTSSFSQYAAFANQGMAIGIGDDARDENVAQVSATFFDFFTARPVLGRFFTPAEDVPPMGASVVVLGYDYWQHHYGGSPDVIGKSLYVGNVSSTIIGVAPEGFTGVIDVEPALFIPITTYAGSRGGRDGATYYTRYNWGWMSMMVRRKPGVTIEQASADATVSARKSYEVNRSQESGMAPVEVAKPAAVIGAMRTAAGPDPSIAAKTALWVSGVAVIVLLIACANVGNLMLGRAIRRRREIAVRLALGVSRGRLVLQSLTESFILSALGCVVGLVIAVWGGAAIRRMLISPTASSVGVFTDWRTLGLAFGATVLAALFIGLVPAMLGTSSDLASSLRAGGRGSTHAPSRARGILLVTQGALSVVLLVGAALFVRSLDKVKAMRMGYDAEHVLRVQRNLRDITFSDSARIAMGRALLERAQAIPSVEYAAYTTSTPFWSTSSTDLRIEGIDSVSRLGQFNYQTSTPDIFKVMGTRILRGRAFTTDDGPGSMPVAVVSEGMAKALWPGKNAIGQCMRVGGGDTVPCTTVIGVAEDIVQRDVMSDKQFMYYLPLAQFRPANGRTLLMKMRGDPRAQIEEVRKVLQAVMPGKTYVTVRPLQDAVDEAQKSWQLGATMFVAFGVLALLVAAMGLYGVIAYNVTQRMHELGVRIALGAQARDILKLVVGQGVAFAAAGIVVGSVLSLIGAKWVEPLLFRQSARDPLVYAFVAALLLLVAVAATLAPAARASKADPNSALRADS